MDCLVVISYEQIIPPLQQGLPFAFHLVDSYDRHTLYALFVMSHFPNKQYIFPKMDETESLSTCGFIER